MRGISRRRAMWMGGAAMASLALATDARAALPSVTAYRNPGCGCCEEWAKRMTAAGFEVAMTDDAALEQRRSGLGVPADIAGCHTATIGDYVVEGHVPPEDVLRMLNEKPMARGLAVPGMPAGSPGMETGGTPDRYDVLLFSADGAWTVFASH